MGDLVRGRYPVQNPLWNFLGRPTNVNQNDLALRSNAEALAFLSSLADTSAALATGVMTVVAVPVQKGDVITQIQVRTGATAAGTPTHSFAAVYAGYAPGNASAVLLAQSVDAGAAAIAASSTITFTLSTPQVVTDQNAPNGYWYVGIVEAATTVSSLATLSVATAVAGAWFTGMAVPCFTVGSALTTAAPAALAAGTAQAAAPVVMLG